MLGTPKELEAIADKAEYLLRQVPEESRWPLVRSAEETMYEAGLVPALRYVKEDWDPEWISTLIRDNLRLPDWLRLNEISAESLKDIETFEELIYRLTPTGSLE